jgi:hypothetical protein
MSYSRLFFFVLEQKTRSRDDLYADYVMVPNYTKVQQFKVSEVKIQTSLSPGEAKMIVQAGASRSPSSWYGSSPFHNSRPMYY